MFVLPGGPGYTMWGMTDLRGPSEFISSFGILRCSILMHLRLSKNHWLLGDERGLRTSASFYINAENKSSYPIVSLLLMHALLGPHQRAHHICTGQGAPTVLNAALQKIRYSLLCQNYYHFSSFFITAT